MTVTPSSLALEGVLVPDAARHRALGVRKVLAIAYRFPPQGGAGVQRTLKFVKYLPQFGWLPVVHTVPNPHWPLEDRSLLDEVPDMVKVYRTRTFEFERLERNAAAWLGDAERDGTTPGRGDAVPARGRSTRPGRPSARGRLKSVADLVRRRVLVPDPQVAWLPGALVKSLYAVRKERPAVLYTSSPPNSVQVLGTLLKRLTGLPWVADFRDPWTEGIRRKEAYVGNPGRQRLEEALERAVVLGADHLIVTTEKTAEQFLQKYPAATAAKFSVITNGFDPADFTLSSVASPVLDRKAFNLTLSGNVETMFDARPFFGAVRALLDEDAGLRADLRVNFIGTKRGKYDDYLAQKGLGDHVRYVPFVPHAVSLQYLAESDVLFLCQIPVYESASTKLSLKLFEYLYLRKPILALTLPGLTADILARSGLGVVVDPADAAGIKKAVLDLYRRWQAGALGVQPDEEYIAGFDRVRQTERLARLFDRVRSEHHGR